MKKIILISMGIAMMLLVGCNSSKKADNQEADAQTEQTEVVADDHSAKNSLDYYGVYEGITPCADCEGIKVTVTLNKDNTYAIKSVYQKNGEEIAPSEHSGNFTWNETGFIITLEGATDVPNRFFVGEGSLTIVDEDGHQISAELAEHYILSQKETF